MSTRTIATRRHQRAPVVLTTLLATALASCAAPAPPAQNNAPAPSTRTTPAPASQTVQAKRPPDEAAFEFVAVDFVDAKTGWIAGRDQEQSVSAIFRTTDGGATWVKLLEISGALIEDVDFADATDGWFATVEGVLYKTGDGGLYWTPDLESKGEWTVQRESPPTIFQDPTLGGAGITGENIVSLFFLDARTGWAAGDAPAGTNMADVRGLVLGTRDGGGTWTELSDPAKNPLPTALNDVWFLNADEGWAAGGFIENADEIDSLFRTSDGGRTWTRVRTGTGQFHRTVQFVTPHSGFVVGITFDLDSGTYGPSKLLATSDGGATWSPKLVVDKSLFDVTFVDAKTGWAVGDYSAIFATTDGGETWSQQATFDVLGSKKAAQVQPEIPRRPSAATAAGPTRDAAMEPRSFHALFFLDAKTGWAGASRAILRRRA
jgi:photosystem II stability/assembly factor-like uncharacterized protein